MKQLDGQQAMEGHGIPEPMTWSTAEVAEKVGLTYRQLDYWVTKGLIPGMGKQGSGNPRRWTLDQLKAAGELKTELDRAKAILKKLGMRHLGRHTEPT